MSYTYTIYCKYTSKYTYFLYIMIHYKLVPDTTRNLQSIDTTSNSKEIDENSVLDPMSSSKNEEILHCEGQFSVCIY